MKKLMLALACFMPLTVSADDHAPMPPAIAVVYECTLNEGVAAADLVACLLYTSPSPRDA